MGDLIGDFAMDYSQGSRHIKLEKESAKGVKADSGRVFLFFESGHNKVNIRFARDNPRNDFTGK